MEDFDEIKVVFFKEVFVIFYDIEFDKDFEVYDFE